MDQQTHSRRLRSNEAAEYLRLHHGVPMSDKSLRNRRCAGTGPVCRYFGSIPVYDPADLDAWVAAALRDEPANKRAA